MPHVRKGAAAIEASATSKSGSGNKPFAPNIRWTENGEEKYILILTPIDETPVYDVHEYVKVGTRDNGKDKYGFYISRKDPSIEEDYDLLQDEFGISPTERTFAVAVELDPEYGTASGNRRPRVTGFKVKTDTYDRKNEDGTSDEVIYPVIGVISQAASNFYNYVRSHDEDYGPIEELPLKVKRIGKSRDTQYSITPHQDQKVDLSNLIEYVENVGYVDDEIVNAAQGQDPHEAALAIAEHILDKRVAELSDKEVYDEEVGPLQVIKGFNKTYERGASTNGAAPEPEAEVPEEAEEEADGAKSEAFQRIKQRAAKKR